MITDMMNHATNNATDESLQMFDVYCTDDTWRQVYLGEVEYGTAELFLDTDRDQEIASIKWTDMDGLDAEDLRILVQLTFDEWEADQLDSEHESQLEAFVVGEYEFRMGISV